MNQLQTHVLGSLRQYSLQAAQAVPQNVLKPHVHLFARMPYAQVTMYRCEQLNAKYEICSTLSFDISQRSSMRIYDLAKFYFKPQSQDEELLLKLLLSDSRLECLEYQKYQEGGTCGLRFIGDHNFMKARLTSDEKFHILKRFVELDASHDTEVTTSITTNRLNFKPIYKKTPSKWDELLHKAFVSANTVQWLGLSKSESASIIQFSKREV